MQVIADWLGALTDWVRSLFEAPDPSSSGERLPPTMNGVLRDPARGREIPFRVYLPRRQTGPAPVVLYSHGLGGSREVAPYIGRALAANGYLAVFVQHPGSDEEILAGASSPEELRGRLKGAMGRPEETLARFLDIPFVVDQLEAMNLRGRLRGRMDLGRIGIAGHSFGARTVLVAAGQRAGPMRGGRLKERRIRAGVALSPSLPTRPGAAMDPAALAGVYDEIDIPILHITGTADGIPLGDGTFDPLTRTLPFRHIDGAEQALLVLDGATHGTFGGHPTREGEAASRAHRMVVTTAMVLFLDAHLKGDAGAHATLLEEFPRSLGPGDTFEVKPPRT